MLTIFNRLQFTVLLDISAYLHSTRPKVVHEGVRSHFISFLFFFFHVPRETKNGQECVCVDKTWNIQGCCDTHQEFLFAREKPDTTKLFVVDSRIKPKTEK